MRRRGITVLVGAILLVLFAWQTTVIKVPYVAMGPGPTVDTLGESDKVPVIQVTGAAKTKSAGQLRLVTIEVQPDLTLFDAMHGWLAGNYAVVPRELIYPPDQSQKDVDAANTAAFQESQTSAETAALRYLGYPVQVRVSQLSSGFDAAKVLAVGDLIQAVDGTPVTSAQKLTELVRAKPAGTARQVTFTRNGASQTAAVTTKKDDDGNPRLGVSVEEKQPHPFQLKIQLDKIGGPSAGLMFTLGIIDTLKAEDLTGGLIIAGTGTIDEEGNVGPIGGIPQKLIAAKSAKAKVFFTPADNCAEAVANAQPNLPLIKVATLNDALNALSSLRAGQTPPLCSR
jgi:PDZ domain-containing protein